MNLFRSPFEKLSTDNLNQIASATTVTAQSVSPGGALFGQIDEMIFLLKQAIKASGKGAKTEKGPEGLQGLDNKTLKLIGPAAQGVAEAFRIIVDAIIKAPDTKEMDEKISSVVNGMAAIVSMGKAIFTFAGLLALSLPLLIIGMFALPIAMTMILLVAGAFWLIDKMQIDKSIKSTSMGLAIAGLAIISLALAFTAFVAISPPLEAIFGIATVIIGTAMIFWVVDQFKGDIIGGALGLMVAGGAIVVLGLSFAIFAAVIPGDWFVTTLQVMLVVVGVAIAFGIAGVFAAEISLGAMAMIESGIAIIALGAGLLLFSFAVTPDAAGWMTIGQVTAALLGVGLVMAAAGFASPFIAPGAAVMIIAGIALISISLGFLAMAKVFKGGRLAELLADSGHKTEGFFGWGAGRMMSNMEWALLSLARSFTLPIASIASMYASAPALIMSGFALFSIARGVKKFQELKIDYEVLPQQIAKVTTVIANAFGEVGKKYPGGGGGFIGAIFGNGTGSSYVAQGISAVGGMGRALTGIATGVQAMADLKFPTKWDKDGNPIEFRELKDEDFERLTRNTQRIVGALSSTFGKIGANPNASDPWGWFGHSKVEEGMQIVGGIGSAISDLGEGVQSIANFRMPIYGTGKNATKIIGYKTLNDAGVLDTAQHNIQRIVKALSHTFGKIGASPDAQDSWGWFGNSNIEEGIEIVSGITKPISKLANVVRTLSSLDKGTMSKADSNIKSLIRKSTSVFAGVKRGGYSADDLEVISESFEDMADAMEDWKDAVNGLDLKKVTEVRKLYEGLAYLSKNGGETAVEKMGKSLVDALNHLSDLLEKAGAGGGSGGGGFFGKMVDKGADMLGIGDDDKKKPTKPTKPDTGKDKPVGGGNTEIAKAISRLNDILDDGIKVDVSKL